jgi:AsmA protein
VEFFRVFALSAIMAVSAIEDRAMWNKAIRAIAIGLGVVVAAAIMLVAVAVYVFEPNDYKQEIADLVERSTGRRLEIAGEVKLAVFPWLRIEAHGLKLSNPTGFGDQPMLRIDTVDMGLRLMPLLIGKLELDTVRLKGLKLALVTNRQGRNNWADLLGADSRQSGKQAGKQGGAGAMLALAVQGVEIQEGHVDWDDRAGGSRYRLRSINLESGAIASGKPVAVHAALEAVMSPDNRVLPVAGSVIMQLDTVAQNLVLSRLEVKLQDQQLPLRLFGERIDWSISKGLVDIQKLEVNMSRWPSQVASVLMPALAVDLASGAVKQSPFELKFGDLRGSGSFSAKQLLGVAQLGGKLVLAEFSPRKLLAGMNIDLMTRDNQVLQRAAMQANFSYTADKSALALSGLDARIDESHLSGKLGLQWAQAMVFDCELKLDELDLDRYLAPGKKAAKAEGQAVPGASILALPLAPLRDAQGKGSIHIGKFRVSGMQMSDIEIGIASQGGVLNLNPLAARLYSGRLDGNMLLDVRSDLPRVEMHETLAGVEIQPLLKAAEITDRLSGRGSLQVKLAVGGIPAGDLLHSLNGKAGFELSEGMIKGIDIRRAIVEARQLYNKLRGKPVEIQAQERDEFRFTALTGSLVISDGVARSDDLYVKSPLFRITGKGEIDLARKMLDYLLDVTVVGTLKGQGGEELHELKGATIPVRLKGKLDRPSYFVDFRELLKRELGRALDRELDKLLRKQE